MATQATAKVAGARVVEVRVRAAMAAAALAEDRVASLVAVDSKGVVVSSPQVGLVGGAAERAAV